MSYAFHRSQRHGPNTRYFPELHSHPTGINNTAKELTSKLTFKDFGPLLLLFTNRGNARRVQLLLQIAFPTLPTFVPLTPLRWQTTDYASPHVQAKVRAQHAKLFRFKPDRTKTNKTNNDSGVDHPEDGLAPTLTEMFGHKKMDFYLRLTAQISTLLAEDRMEDAQRLLDRTDYIPIKMNLRNSAIFDSVVFIGLPNTHNTHTENTGSHRPFKTNLGLRLIKEDSQQSGEADLVNGLNTNTSFPQKKGTQNEVRFSADPRESRPLHINEDHLGMSQTDLAHKYKVPLVGRRLRRRDELPFSPEAEVQPDAWWEDPSSYLPGPSKRYLPPPKAYVEWLSEERALSTPDQLKQAISRPAGKPPVLTDNLRYRFERLVSQILDHESIKSRVQGFFFVKDQSGAMQELRALTLYLQRHRPHPQNEEQANRFSPLKAQDFWSGVSQLYRPLRQAACRDITILDLGPSCVFSTECPLHGLQAIRLKDWEQSPGWLKFMNYNVKIGRERPVKVKLRFKDWFSRSLPKNIPDGCEPVLVFMTGLQLILIFVVESNQIQPSDLKYFDLVNPLTPSDLTDLIGDGRQIISGRNGIYNSKQIKMMDSGSWPDDPRLVMEMYKTAGLAFGVKPGLLKRILQPINNH